MEPGLHRKMQTLSPKQWSIYLGGEWKDLKFGIDIIYFKIISEFAMHVKLGDRCDTIVIGSQTNFRA